WDHGELPLDPPRLPDAILLSHAHLDHCGALPVTYKHEAVPTFCTFPTSPVTQLLLEDSLKIARQEKRPSHFSKADAGKALKNMVCLPYEREYEFFEGTTFEFLDAGHIIGSAQTILRTKNKGKSFSLAYTGDFKMTATRVHSGAKPLKEEVDALVIESTYALREHPPREQVEKEFCDAVQGVLDDGGNVLLPCFAVGRTAEILSVLYENGFRNDIWVDGMGAKVLQIMCDYPSYVSNYKRLMEAFRNSQNIEHHGMRREALEKPSIIIATAGMLEGGPALGFIEKMNADRKGKHAIFLTGFQVPGTNGDRLLKEGKIKLKGRIASIDLPVKQFAFSAHADRKDLLEYVKKASPEKVFCIHGDEGACEAFAAELKEQGFDAIAPRAGEQAVL
ncbi:MAG: MBL fold metallo-hydrolase, partial [Candidatus Norongarragalinales archaeon]